MDTNVQIKEYKVVEATSRSELEREVNSLIRQGWQPQGGIAYSSPKSEWYQINFLQALVR